VANAENNERERPGNAPIAVSERMDVGQAPHRPSTQGNDGLVRKFTLPPKALVEGVTHVIQETHHFCMLWRGETVLAPDPHLSSAKHTFPDPHSSCDFEDPFPLPAPPLHPIPDQALFGKDRRFWIYNKKHITK
jgi:hypothetical protein